MIGILFQYVYFKWKSYFNINKIDGIEEMKLKIKPDKVNQLIYHRVDFLYSWNNIY